MRVLRKISSGDENDDWLRCEATIGLWHLGDVAGATRIARRLVEDGVASEIVDYLCKMGLTVMEA